jgi:hypothetical protein
MASSDRNLNGIWSILYDMVVARGITPSPSIIPSCGGIYDLLVLLKSTLP